MNLKESPKTKRGRLYHDVSTRLIKLVQLIMMLIPFAYIWYAFYADILWVPFFRKGHWLVLCIFVAVYFLVGRVYEAFVISRNRVSEMIFSQTLTAFLTDAGMFILTWLLVRDIPYALPFIACAVVQNIVAIIWTHSARAWYFRTFPPNKTIVIWDLRKGVSRLIDRYHLGRKYDVVKDANIEECIEDLSILDRVDTVFLVGIHSHDRNIVLKYCLKNGIQALVIPRVGDLILTGATRVNMFNLLMLKVERYNPLFEYMVIKRFMDIVLSLIAIAIFSPVFLISAICIKAEDGGPVIYKQRRITQDAREFDIYKFRSMVEDAEKDGIIILSDNSDDERITRVGRVMRRFRIDELPQLFNIIKGDLSIVGPRPERPELVKEYEAELPEFSLRLQMKAGLTGLAQIYGKYDSSTYDKLLMDLMYIANASVFEDLKIMLATVKFLFMPRPPDM